MTSPFRLSSPSLRYLAWLLDVVIISAAAAVSSHLYLGAWDLAFDFTGAYFQMIVAASLMLSLFSGQIYRSWRVNDLWSILGTVSRVCLMLLLLLALYLFLAKTSIYVSRIWFLIWGVASWIALILQRLIIYLILRWLRRQGYNYKTLLLVGVGAISERVVAEIDAAAWSGIRIVGVVHQDELHAWVDQPESVQPNEIWICMPMSDEVGIRQVLNALRHSFSNIRLVPDVFSFRLVIVDAAVRHSDGYESFYL